jgi:hypothetical protein
MKYLVAAVLVLTLSACTTTHQLVCRHTSVACALVIGEKYKQRSVGIAVGDSIAAGQRHAQAFVRVDKRLEWIEYSQDSCSLGKKEGFIPVEFLTVSEFVREYF